MGEQRWTLGFPDGSGKQRILCNGVSVASLTWGCGCCESEPTEVDLVIGSEIVAAMNNLSRVAAMEESLRKIASTADMSKYRPNELERCCLPDSAVDSDGFADMPTDMKLGLDYNAKIAHAALTKSALEGAGG